MEVRKYEVMCEMRWTKVSLEIKKQKQSLNNNILYIYIYTDR